LGEKECRKGKKSGRKGVKSAKEDHEATGSFVPEIVWYMLGKLQIKTDSIWEDFLGGLTVLGKSAVRTHSSLGRILWMTGRAGNLL
jgi:hypothetical protein